MAACTLRSAADSGRLGRPLIRPTQIIKQLASPGEMKHSAARVHLHIEGLESATVIIIIIPSAHAPIINS